MAIVGDRSSLEEFLVQFRADRESLERSYPLSISFETLTRFDRFYQEWSDALAKLDWNELNRQGRIDAILFRNLLDRAEADLNTRRERLTRIQSLLPFPDSLIQLLVRHRQLEPVDSKTAAAVLSDTATRKTVDQPDFGDAFHVAEAVAEIRKALKDWFDFYNGYDPGFTWWVQQPFADADKALEACEVDLRGQLTDPAALIVGPPVGREELQRQVELEMICYSPEELIEIGEREFAWCRAEMRKAAAELGFGDDTKAALEHVKELYVEPGRQAEIVKELAVEAIKFLTDRDLVTVPPLAAETWRMGMMSAEKQKVNPFFLGGEQIIVSYPTIEMSHAEKRMSMRGNNPHFSRATVQHELIPGHHLQFFQLERHKPYRSIFGTCFWIEGWALYWELLLWDLDFPKGPEDRIGMLFWRMHRCARIVFSLKYHLGQMTAQECVDLLVEEVGHERANAEGEVRRSFRGDYPPLYQAAYMLGGLQLSDLRRELVDTGRMTDREFHDAIMHENQMPLAVLRALLSGQELSREFRPGWKFYDTQTAGAVAVKA